MKRPLLLLVLIALVTLLTSHQPVLAQSNGGGATLKPPMAEKKTKTTNIHGETIVDDYFWLREKSNPQVMAYLEAENAHTDAAMKPTEALQQKLYKEMVGHIKETDQRAIPHGFLFLLHAN